MDPGLRREGERIFAARAARLEFLPSLVVQPARRRVPSAQGMPNLVDAKQQLAVIDAVHVRLWFRSPQICLISSIHSSPKSNPGEGP